MCRVRSALILLLFSSVSMAASVYRYHGPNGQIIFSERKLDNPDYQLVSHSRDGRYLGKLATPVSQPDKKQIDAMIESTAKRYQLEAKLISAIVEIESNFQADALSSAGAVGLMQLMPDTAADYAIAELYDAQANLDAGARHLLNLFKEFKDLDLVLAAYNAGAGTVRRYGGVPPFKETERYIEKVKDIIAAAQ